MPVRFSELTVDSKDPRALAAFWCEVLGYSILSDEDGIVEIGIGPQDREAMRAGPVLPTILFVPVPEQKTVKNRLHIDLSPVGRSRDAEVDRILALGARKVDIGQGEVTWVVLADPEGNEFCILRGSSS